MGYRRWSTSSVVYRQRKFPSTLIPHHQARHALILQMAVRRCCCRADYVSLLYTGLLDIEGKQQQKQLIKKVEFVTKYATFHLCPPTVACSPDIDADRYVLIHCCGAFERNAPFWIFRFKANRMRPKTPSPRGWLCSRLYPCMHASHIPLQLPQIISYCIAPKDRIGRSVEFSHAHDMSAPQSHTVSSLFITVILEWSRLSTGRTKFWLVCWRSRSVRSGLRSDKTVVNGNCAV